MPERSEVMVALVGDAGFTRRVIALMVIYALSVFREGLDVDNHDRRANLAYNILSNPLGMVDRFAWAVAADPVVQQKYLEGQAKSPAEKPKDDILLHAVSSSWNAVAGVGG